MIFILFSFTDLGCAVQLMNILRILIDPENMLATVAVSIYLQATGLPPHTQDSYDCWTIHAKVLFCLRFK